MMKKNLFYSVSAALLAAGMMALASCSKDVVSEFVDAGTQQEQSESEGKAVVKLVFSSPSVSSEAMEARRSGDILNARGLTRASMMANGKELTDLYVLDYDKATGKLLQVLHQTSEAEDFAEPSMSFAYGEHTLKVIATRSETSTLLDSEGSLWSLAENTAFAIADDAHAPVVWTSEKTSDSFGASVDVTIQAAKNQAINIQLERMVAKLVLKNTGTFPDDCSTIQMSLDEYKAWNWQSFSVIDAVKNQRTSDVSKYAGKTGSSISYFFLAPDGDGYTTNISFQMNRKDSEEPYTSFTLSDVRLQRNHITTVAGSFYDHQAGFSLSVNDGWDEEQNNVEF